MKDLEFELQARKGRDEARSPEVQRQRQRAEAFRQEAAQARGALDAERAARDAADALGRRPRAAMASSNVTSVIWPRAFAAFWMTAGSAALPHRSRHLLCTRSAGKQPWPSTSAS